MVRQRGQIKPKPLLSLNHFTLPVLMCTAPWPLKNLTQLSLSHYFAGLGPKRQKTTRTHRHHCGIIDIAQPQCCMPTKTRHCPCRSGNSKIILRILHFLIILQPYEAKNTLENLRIRTLCTPGLCVSLGVMKDGFLRVLSRTSANRSAGYKKTAKASHSRPAVFIFLHLPR